MSERKISLPLVPLRGLVAFPKTELRLEIGRDKSKEAVNRAMEQERLLLVASQLDEDIDEPTQKDIAEFGTLVRIQQKLRLPGGLVRVLVEGVARVRLTEVIVGDDLYSATGEILESEYGNPVELEAYRRLAQGEFLKWAEESKLLTEEEIRSVTHRNDASETADQIALLLQAPIDTRLKFLGELNVQRRLNMVVGALNMEREISTLENNINRQVRTQMEKQQKEYFLREKIRAIHDELGDKQDPDEEAQELRERLAKLELSDELRERVEKEIQRYSRMPQMMPETSLLRNYLDWVLSLPWNTLSEDRLEVDEAAKILDEDHYGLKKIKERIMEFLAVRKLTSGGKSPILCLVGPPGTGKTSIAKSVAEALHKKYVRICLGGVRDEAEIRGHRKTYVGAMPGRITAALSQAGVSNPLMLLDEIDKTSSDYKGDTSAALLEVLDSEQNVNFVDHYIEMPVDLSNVLFIATANDLSNISRPLLDRMEIIEVGSYTANEKFHIAKEHLIKKQIKENGLLVSDVKFTDKVIRTIINSYTREAGVRGLERQIAKIVRRAVRELYKAGVFTSDGTRDKTVKKTVNISDKNITDYLGKVKYRPDKKNAKGEVGIVRGLAWTQVGGDTLQIEVNVMPGKGELVLTGQLGDVMKESAQDRKSVV
mgnify:CR=1 FL=1